MVVGKDLIEGKQLTTYEGPNFFYIVRILYFEKTLPYKHYILQIKK